ncbi:MAG: hypothetical protein LH481_14195, partial [Burkholderiales bacterium]|nr:hypothetical protein [Burkholderiales bacterium]
MVVPLATMLWLATTPVHAQQSPAADASVADAKKVPAPYVDRVMEGVSTDTSDESIAEYDASGWPRGISLQLTRNFQSSQNASASSRNVRTDTQGIQLDAYVDTPNFGSFSLHALSLGGSNTTGLTSWSVRQKGLPFDGGWRVDNALGTTNLLVPELARRNSRLTLPSTQVLGGSTIWRNEGGGNALTLGASAGEPGRFEGFPQSRFVGLGGRVNSLYAQTTQGEWSVAAAVAHGSGILPEIASQDGDAARISPRGTYVSIAKGDLLTGASWQASAIGSSSAGIDATGLWADALWRDGGHRHQASIFRYTEGLTWIDRPLAADLQGASYRYDYTALRWDVSANIESFTSVSGKNPSGWYGSASVRRLLGEGVSTGGGFAARSFGVTGASAFGYLQWRNSLGMSRAQIDAASTQGGDSSQALTFDHSFYTEDGLSLSTSLSLERLQPTTSMLEAPRPRERAATLGFNGRAVLTNSVSAQGSLRARSVAGGGIN